MAKFSFGNAQYIVYAENQQEAQKVIRQELKRFDEIKEKVSALLSPSGIASENFMENSSEENLNIHFNDTTSLIFDDPKNALTRGEVRIRGGWQNGKAKYKLAYRYPNINGQNADFRLAHEMGHLILNPADVKLQTKDKKTNTRQVAGLIRMKKDGAFYGQELQENAVNLIAELAIRGEHSADEIIMGNANVAELNEYQKCDDLVKLLVVSMRNDFIRESSFEQLVNQKLDSMIEMPDGTKQPVNMFFYGMLTDSSMIEHEFDKYMGKNAWQKLNENISKLHKLNPIENKFNKIYEATKKIILEFANVRMQDKQKEAISKYGTALPLDNKINMINQMIGVEIPHNQSQSINANLPNGYQINELGEIIRTEKSDKKSSNMPNQANTSLTFIQKIAQMIKKNEILMNISLFSNFVNKQLNLLPPVTNNNLEKMAQGRISDPNKLEYMRRRMEQDEYNKLLTSVRGHSSENEYEKRCQEASNTWEQRKQRATAKNLDKDMEEPISR